MNKYSPFIIAEAGVNHNGDLSKAYKLVDIAKKAGADAIKFQLYDIKEQISIIAKTARYQRKSTKESNMLKMARSYTLPLKAHIKIKSYCDKKKIQYMASCCDIESIDFYKNKLKAKVLKISSGEITNLNLLKYAANQNINTIISTGMANTAEISEAVSIFKKYSRSKLFLLHCISNYPGKDTEQNLSTIKFLENKFKCAIGYSDHTTGYICSIVATILGARIIEKHFTYDKRAKGPDHHMSMGPEEFIKFIKNLRNLKKIIKPNLKNKIISNKEREMIKIARRGLISIKNIIKGETFNSKNIAAKRPATGIEVNHLKKVINKKASINIKANTPIKWEYIKK
jgi:N,N'-diacetyllegionaminate synthase